MTTTAATTSTSASTSSPPKDSPELHDFEDNDEEEEEDGALKPAVEQPEHNHTGRRCQPNSEQSPPSSQQPTPPPSSQDRTQSPSELQSTEVNVSNTTDTKTTTAPTSNTTTPPIQATISSTPTAVSNTQNDQQLEQSTSSHQQLQQSTTNSNSSEQKRPMNAFLLFCKRQRSLVKEKYPNLENRGITKILGDWWSKLDKEQKSKYTDLARQHKEAFMKANPDFKWCKTPNVSNINNNIGTNDTDNDSCNHSSTSQHQQQKQSQHFQRLQQQNNRHPSTANNVDLLSSQPNHHPMEVVYHSANSMDIMLKSRQQLEAPKPPKKRFLERNDSVYISKNSYGPNHSDSNSHGTDVVPFSLDQNFLDRVIDKAFSEDSSSSPSGANSCKCSNRNTTNLTTASSTNQTPFSSSSATNYAANIDEPVDFSMNKTFSATSQQIINNLVEKMLSDGPDNNSSFSKMNGTDSVRPQIRPPVKRDNPDVT